MEDFLLKEHIAKRIRTLRLSKGFTQESLAEKANLSHNYLYRIENKLVNAKLDSIQKIMTALDVSPSQFFNLPNTTHYDPKLLSVIEDISRLSKSQQDKIIKGLRYLIDAFD